MKIPNSFAILCDWLQLHVKVPDDFLEIENPWYTFTRIGQSKTFRDIYEIRHTAMNMVVATYCCNSTVMRPGHGILKFANSVLYNQDDLKAYVKIFLGRLQFAFKSVTRFDIAFDFQKFYMGYDPMLFLKRYAEHKIIRSGATKKVNSLMFKQHVRYHQFETYYAGSKKSDIQLKMYNKTSELKSNSKPYISAIHKDTFKNEHDVWRIEFSIYSIRALLKDINGVKTDYNSLDILDITTMYGIFQGLFEKHFDWRTCGHEKRTARMKKIQLWHFDYNGLKKSLHKQNPLIKPLDRGVKNLLRGLNDLIVSEPLPEVKKISDRLFGIAVKLFQVKEYDESKTKDDFISKVKKSITSDCSVKRHLSKLQKVVNGKSYDENLIASAKEVMQKLTVEYGTYDFAEKLGLDVSQYEGYMDNVYEFLKMKGNEDSLAIQFKNAMRIQALIEDDGWIKTV